MTTSATVSTTTTTSIVSSVNTVLNHEENGLQQLDTSTSFRLQGKRIFITFPQCSVSKEEALKRIVENNSTSTCKVVVSEERHQDGNQHLHIFLERPKPFNVRAASSFDFIGGKRGNYQKVRCFKACIRYITKEGNFVSHKIDVPEIIKAYEESSQKKRKHVKLGYSQSIYQMLSNGKSYNDVLQDKELGSFCVLHSNQVKRVAQDFQQQLELKERKEKRPRFLHFILNGMEYDMLQEMPFKSPQFWIYGPPNTGKSTFIRKLEESGLVGFEIPVNNDFATWDDDKYDFAYIDEFKGQLTIQFLNLFLQGSKMTLPGKYVAGGRIKNRNIPVFILSNYTPEEVYHKKSLRDLEPLLCRLRIINLLSFQDYDIITRDTNGSPLYLNELYTDEQLD